MQVRTHVGGGGVSSGEGVKKMMIGMGVTIDDGSNDWATTDERSVEVILPVYEATQNSAKFEPKTKLLLSVYRTTGPIPEQHIHELSEIIILCNLMLHKVPKY